MYLFKFIYENHVLVLQAGILADVVSGAVASQVVPVVVPEDGEEGVVDLHHAETHLPAVVVVVGLALSPVKPAHGLVAVLPDPLPGRVLVVAALEGK